MQVQVLPSALLLSPRRGRYAILWRFGSSGIATCDQVQAVVSEGRDATHVRDVAVLPKVRWGPEPSARAKVAEGAQDRLT